MMTVLCPECDKPFELSSTPIIGQAVYCPACHTNLDVIWLYPICLDHHDVKDFPDQPARIEA